MELNHVVPSRARFQLGDLLLGRIRHHQHPEAIPLCRGHGTKQGRSACRLQPAGRARYPDHPHRIHRQRGHGCRLVGLPQATDFQQGRRHGDRPDGSLSKITTRGYRPGNFTPS